MVDDGAVQGRLCFNLDRIGRFTSAEPTIISVRRPGSQGRDRVEAYIEAGYVRAFGGRIPRHCPILISLEDGSGDVSAAAGVRMAGREPLYLEHYLDEPVEAALGRIVGAPMERRRIAEIGSLASHSQGASVFLFIALAKHLQRHGCTHVVATATRQLRRSFAQFGFETHRLAPATASRVAAVAGCGDYCDRPPEILAGAISNAVPVLSRLLKSDPSLKPGLLQ